MSCDSLEKYIGLYHGTVYRLALSYTKNSADAEDITQEAFLRLYKYSGEFAADENCKAWLIRVTVNLSKNLLKSCWFTRRAELDENIPCKSEEDRGVFDCVMSLPPKYRVVIHLYYYEGYSVREIADMLGASQSSITTRLARGRQKIKDMFQKEGL